MTSAREIPFPRGTCPIYTFGPPGDRSAPVVLLFMDAFGPRPALFAIAERLAKDGYRVLLPHLFYHHLPFDPLDPQKIFNGGEDQKRLMDMFRSIDQSMIDADVTALLAYADEQFGTAVPIGATGYCMGGRYALTAAAISPRIVMAASFHGSNLALETEDSPHKRLDGIKARIYVGVAGVDPMFEAAEEGRLAAALRDGNVDHVIETYAGAMHGFVMEDLPVHDSAAAERHWNRLSENLREAFSQSA